MRKVRRWGMGSGGLLFFASALTLDPTSPTSLRDTSSSLAYGLMAWYHNNQSTTAATAIGTLDQPYYWWEAGAIWGGMIDYWSYTGDASYVPTVSQALLAQIGPERNFMPPAYYSSLGNDDQAFWAMASLSALEYGFPVPAGSAGSLWRDLATAVWESMVPRWDTGTCEGGLRWQIFESNNGWDYKNTISNGGFFQISARLARYTASSNPTQSAAYAAWAAKIWDWMFAIGLVNDSYQVFDGTDPKINCSSIDHTAWSYNAAVLMYGAAMLYDATGEQVWADRTTGLLGFIEQTYLSPPYGNATNIAYEYACEPTSHCNNDQYSFKAYLSRWLVKSAILLPSLLDARVRPLIAASAVAAAQSCSGGANGQTCGTKWYVGGYDGVFGPGQELSALETVQGLLALVEGGRVPLREGQSLSSSSTSASATPTATTSSSAVFTPPTTTTTSSSFATPSTPTTTTTTSSTPTTTMTTLPHSIIVVTAPHPESSASSSTALSLPSTASSTTVAHVVSSVPATTLSAPPTAVSALDGSGPTPNLSAATRSAGRGRGVVGMVMGMVVMGLGAAAVFV